LPQDARDVRPRLFFAAALTVVVGRPHEYAIGRFDSSIGPL